MPEHSQSDAAELAQVSERLAANRDRIIEDWLKAVSDDDQIPSADRLSMGSLKDHFPDMLSELIAAVRQGRHDANDSTTRNTGRAHGKTRWQNGYRLDEVLRELARVREIIIDDAMAFCRGRISEKVRENVVQTIRVFFDTIVATSAQQFLQAQDAEVVLRTSQLQNAYEQVQAATEQVRLVSESRLRLLRAVTHELRNALQPVGFAAQALLEESDPENRREIGKQLVGVAGHLQILLDRLRELSKILAGETRVRLEKVDLDELLHDLEERHRFVAESKGLQFQFRRTVDSAEITSDPDKLREIGTNLLSNAIKFTNAGFVHIEIAAADDDRWILRVTDSGCGIDPIESRQLFKEFHSGNDLHSGLHLGLIFTRHLAHLLGGEITFQSTVDDGSRFEVNLPRVSLSRD
jgi:signal transduction histidine kinase